MTTSKAATIYRDTSTKPQPSRPFAYAELLGRSHFSFLQGASSPEEVIEAARQNGYAGLALCDLNGLYGVVRAYSAVNFPSNFLTQSLDESPEFQLMIGSELTLTDGSSVALLPMNKDGYSRLCQLITLAKRPAPKGFTSLGLELLCSHHEDFIALALPPWKEEHLIQLQRAFHDRLYLPVWRDQTWESFQHYQEALAYERQGFQLVATQRPFMHCKARKSLHDVLTCILHGKTLRQIGIKLLSNSERYLHPLNALYEIWQDRPDLLTTTVHIAQKIRFSLSELKYQYPQADLPPQMNATEYLRELTLNGLSWRFPLGVPNKVLDMAERELRIIHELAYEDYFLTLYDICEFARRREILFQGRGSAANSVVCYALGLTAVNPMQIDLLFERFISKERGEPPDIDVDFEHHRREEVIQYIYQKYGADHAAMVCTVVCYRSRMALRETAKVLGIPNQIIDYLIKFMGRDGLKRLIENPDKSSEWGLTEKQFKLLISIAGALKGFPRHLSIHTGGFLITQRPITDCVPVEKSTMDQRYVIQWNKDDLTILKMMKIDVLSLGMLSALQKSFKLLTQHKDISLHLANIPPDDKPTYDMISRADTIGVFQIESRAQMSLLPRLEPRNYYDLVVEVAIVRPGPIQGGMVHPYIRRRHGHERIHFPHPALRPILGRTFGVPIFQEQIMQMASQVGGFTPGEADELRRIMSSSWKKDDLMRGLRQRLIGGMLQNGLSTQYAEQIYQTIVGFASYGFPESHAASFALLTYASSYIKCHHPDVFACALLNSQPMGFYPPRILIRDAQKHGVQFLPLDVQISKYDYDLEGSQKQGHFFVRSGLRAIYGLQQNHIHKLIEARQQDGPFKNLHDFVRRTGLSRSVLLRLAAAGAFSSLGIEPREALWRIQGLELQPESLFFGMNRETLHQQGHEREVIPQETPWEGLIREYTHQGHSISQHPLALLRPYLTKQMTSQNLQALPHQTRVTISGLISLLQRPPTAKGFSFLSMEDEAGIFNVILKPNIYEKYRMMLAFHPIIQVEGVLEKSNGVAHVKASQISPVPLHQFLGPPLAPPQLGDNMYS